MDLRRTWTGWSIVAVGLIHGIAGLLLFKAALSGMIGDGLWNSVDGHPGRPAAFWFMMTGLCLIMLGAGVTALQRARVAIPLILSWLFAAMVAIAVIAIPFSGAWLLVPAAAALLWHSVRPQSDTPEESA